MKTILITGGAGFIGSNFVDHIFNKYPDYKLIVLDALTYAGNLDNFSEGLKHSSRFEFWQGNVQNAALVADLVSRADIIVHFAAESHVARSIYDNTAFFETDVLGTQVVANAVVNHGVERFIHISTSEVYGTSLTDPMTEDHPLNPMSPYASAKTGADRLVYSYVQTYGIPAVIIRPFNNYGPCQHLEKVIPRFITSALMGEPLTVHGDGNSSRDWLFVKDCCEGLDRVMHADLDAVKGRAINLGTGRDYTVKQIADRILDLTGKPVSLITYIDDRPGQVKRHISSTDLSKELLGWKAGSDLDAGLEKTVQWYKENKGWWERMLWMRYAPNFY